VHLISAGFVDRTTQHVHDATSVPVPTGTEIALPVALTAIAAAQTVGEPIAIVRTTPSPSCCCTFEGQTRFGSGATQRQPNVKAS